MTCNSDDGDDILNTLIKSLQIDKQSCGNADHQEHRNKRYRMWTLVLVKIAPLLSQIKWRIYKGNTFGDFCFFQNLCVNFSEAYYIPFEIFVYYSSKRSVLHYPSGAFLLHS